MTPKLGGVIAISFHLIFVKDLRVYKSIEENSKINKTYCWMNRTFYFLCIYIWA
jgi:hypothetical protein